MDDYKKICLIVAVAQNNVIGRDNDLPWRLRSDLQRFKKITMGHPILMGRKTFESLPRVLPGRKSIVLTRDPEFKVDHEDVTVAGDVANALHCVPEGETVYVIGGANIYKQFLPLASELMITRVLADVSGDTYFPELDLTDWQLIGHEEVAADEHNDYASRYEHWRRH